MNLTKEQLEELKTREPTKEEKKILIELMKRLGYTNIKIVNTTIAATNTLGQDAVIDISTLISYISYTSSILKEKLWGF